MTNTDYAIILFLAYLIITGVTMVLFIKLANRRKNKNIVSNKQDPNKIINYVTIDDTLNVSVYNISTTRVYNY